MNSYICRALKCFLLLGACLFAGCQPAKHDETPNAGKNEPAKEARSKEALAKYGATNNAPTDGRAVLERMVAAYKNCKSYSDYGVVTYQADWAKGPINERADFQVAFERPNKLHMKVYSGDVRCDGKHWFAFSNRAAGQYVERDAPAVIRLDMLKADQVLSDSLMVGMAGSSLQVMLLTYDDPLNVLLADSDDVQLEEAGRLGDHNCYRVAVKRKDGNCVYWIDQESFVVRQMMVPSDIVRRDLELQGAVNSISIVASFDKAQFDAPIDPVAFQFEPPDAGKKVKVLLPSTPYDLIGKKLPEYHFKDLHDARWDSTSYLGKIVLLEFWSSDNPLCLDDLPKIQELYDKYKSSDKVAVFAVCLDPDGRSNAEVAESASLMKINVPILRDPDKDAGKLLEVIGPPTTLFIDAQGALQDCSLGGKKVVAAAAPHKIERMLAGETLAQEALGQMRDEIKLYEHEVDQIFAATAQVEVAIDAKTAPAAKSRPKSFHLVPLWKSTEVRPAGNMLALPQPNGSVRLIVIDGYKGVAEFTGGGKLLASHKPQLEPEELITNLRVGAGNDGKLWIVGLAPSHQRLHIFDGSLKPILSYPPDALTNRHTGISDVQLGDLDGDGALKMYISYWGAVGVHAVTMDGRRLASGHDLLNVSKLVIGPTGEDKKRDLYCVNEEGSLGVLNNKLRLHGAVPLPGQMFLQGLVAFDLAGDGQCLWCGISQSPDRQFTAMGLTLRGEMLWNFPLPKGTQQPLEGILTGSLTPGGPKHWILPGCDGSINIVAANGQVVDRFNYGAATNGVATYTLDGKQVMVIASPDGVEAFRIE